MFAFVAASEALVTTGWVVSLLPGLPLVKFSRAAALSLAKLESNAAATYK